jgi:hypothetical protein
MQISECKPVVVAPLGSGSYDGILGATLNARWRRSFLNTQVQYYLRTKGESSFGYGDDFFVTLAPGYYLVGVSEAPPGWPFIVPSSIAT